jgi:hypothetical protein
LQGGAATQEVTMARKTSYKLLFLYLLNDTPAVLVAHAAVMKTHKDKWGTERERNHVQRGLFGKPNAGDNNEGPDSTKANTFT